MKLALCQRQLREKNIDLVFLVHPDSNITYFTQLKPSFAYLTITPDSASLYLTKLDSFPPMKGIATYVLIKGWDKKMTSPKVKTVGVNKESLPVAFLEKLQKLFPHAAFVDVSAMLKELRLQKTALEIKKIKKACAITSSALTAFIDSFSFQKFVTEQDVSFFLEKEINDAGAGVAFPTIIAMGKNAAVPHHQTSFEKLKNGFLLFDFGACYQHYCADMSRVLFLGTPTKEEKEFYQLLLQCQTDTIAQIKHRRPFQELDTFSRKKLGCYASYFIHSLGHGIGIDVHEPPSLSPESTAKVENKHVFTIEPGIYFPKKWGLRIEDTIVFDGKSSVLTTAPKELITLKI